MALIDINAFFTLVDKRYREIRDMEIASLEDQIRDYYTIESSDAFEERRGSTGANPLWDEFNSNQEGTGSVSYVRFYEQYNAVSTHREFAQGMRWQRRMVDDDQTGIMRGDRFRKMVNSGIKTRQRHAARLWNFADSNDMYFYVRSEGVPLASNSHTTPTPNVSTTTGFDNLVTSELSQTSYRMARQMMRRFADDQGHIINAMADTLVVPIELEETGREILMSTHAPEDGTSAINPEYGTAKLKTCIYWDDANDWAIVNDKMMHDECTWWDRIMPDFQTIMDFDTKQLKASGYGRWSTMVLDWRWGLHGRVS